MKRVDAGPVERTANEGPGSLDSALKRSNLIEEDVRYTGA